MSYNSLLEYIRLVRQVESYNNIPESLIHSFKSYIMLVYQSDLQNEFSKPMPWIGMYIALASLFCIFAMAGDLLHGFRNRKLWFPCQYFTLNAASLTVIAIAMKLPVDLNNSMPGYVDQTAKLGSMAFMCTIMANSLPCIATMGPKEVFTNIMALGFLVITVIVNVCMQINTGVLSYYMDDEDLLEHIYDANDLSSQTHLCDRSFLAITYVVMLVMLLIIYVCSSLAILKSKQMQESNYKAAHEKALKDLQVGRSTVEKLKQHVTKYWIMAGTSSSLFMTACSATTSASGVLSAINTIVHGTTMFFMCAHIRKHNLDNKSDYKWSMLVIVSIQFIGVLVGTIAPILRCFAELSFRVSVKSIWNHISIFKVESYWTQTLCDWKHGIIPFSISSSRKGKKFVQKIKILILQFCIGFLKIVVVACKMIALVPIFGVIFWKWFQTLFSGSVCDLHNQDDVELADRTMEKILNSVDSFIKKAEKQQPDNLLKLVESSIGFEAFKLFNRHHVLPLLSEEPLSCWSLHVVTLSSIAFSLPNIPNKIVDSLLNSVNEGLAYVTVIEESLNATDEYISIQRAAKVLWTEVEVYNRWLGNKLQNPTSHHLNSTRQILEWYRDTARNMVIEMESKDIRDQNDSCIICANSMYCISETILLSYHSNSEQVSQEELFEQLSSMIANILAACLTNLPQVIALKCHKSVMEEREASVRAAAQLLGETKQIINNLQDRELPSLNPKEFPLIEKWHAYYKASFP